MGRKVTIAIFSFFVMLMQAASVCRGENDESLRPHGSCANLNSANKILQCAIQNHPLIQVIKTDIEARSHRIGVARQMPNPELEVEGVKKAGDGMTSELNLLHTFELGRKRSARVSLARARKTASEIELLRKRESIAVRTVLDLYRMRQITAELDVVEESRETFESIREQYEKLGRLNPEQQVSIAIFNLAQEQNALKEAALRNEVEGIASKLQFILGAPVTFSVDVLPKLKSDWPDLGVVELGGSAIQEIENNITIAKGNYAQARGRSWPDLAIGPKVEIDTGTFDEQLYGLALALPLPLYQTNKSGRAAALQGVRREELFSTYARSDLEREVKYLHLVYRRCALAVLRALERKEIIAQHTELHKLLKRGVISASLVIELHRQLLEYFDTLHVQELQGVEALWKLYALQGTIFEEEIR